MEVHKVKYIVDNINKYKEQPDGTYELVTGKEVIYVDGYQVTFVRPEAYEQLNCEQWDILTNYFCVYFQSEVHIGVYKGEAEVSFHSIQVDKAKEIMIKYNQESILDWKGKHDYPNTIIRWFIFNPYFQQEVMIDYGKILEEIQ